ncbi:MAG: hypothetical protein PUD20_06010 [bacterium]|nr:hypothetical protein [bacterium]
MDRENPEKKPKSLPKKPFSWRGGQIEKEEDIIKNRARHEITELKQMLRAINEYLKHAPKGGLKIQQRLGNTYYYHQQKSDETSVYIKHYISKKDEELAKTLAQKGYYTKVKPVLEKNLHALEELVNTYDKDAIDRVYDTLIDARKNLVNPIKVSAKEQLRRWNEECYEPYQKYPENLRYETEKGEMVRSKSEVIIANILYQHRKDLLYKYERPLEVMMGGRVQIIHPDFTILNLHTGNIGYWEHAGRMDDARYVNEFVQKMNAYIENEIIPGEDVIVTYETMNHPLNIHNVKVLVKRLLEKIVEEGCLHDYNYRRD